MIREIIIDSNLRQTRVALLEDKELVEIYIERPYTENLVGNIYRGKVSSILPGMQAAFIDIGYEKNAFLYVADVLPKNPYDDSEENLNDINNNIEDILKVGQEITVQVIKEPIGTKGPRVSTNFTLPGRDLVLMPTANYVGISRRIGDESERNRLKQIAEKIKPDEMGIIIRTIAESKNEEEFINDIDFLKKLWNKIKNSEIRGVAPRCIHKDLSIIYRVVRDMFSSEINKFIINDINEYKKVLDLVEMVSPSLKSKVEYYSDSIELFDYYQIESMILKSLAKKVWLKCGGYLVIEQTEALTVIDVNTGKYVGGKNLEDTVLNTNIDAAKEIARQLRVRDIGGIIIIDFIDMHEYQHQKLIIDVLTEALKKDRTRTTVVGMTGLGLIEMTRKKIRQTLSSVLTVECSTCAGAGRVLR